MADKIYQKYTVLKKDLFMTLINHMKLNGWTRLNEGHPLTGNSQFIMHSKGTAGDKPMYISLAPYDGNDVIGKSGYDIRTTDYSDGVYRMGSGYDPDTGALIGPFSADSFDTLSFFPGRSYSSAGSAYSRTWNREFEIDFYIYADADFVAYCVRPLDYTGLENCFTFFGIPEKEYLQEVKTPAYSNFIFGTSGRNAWERNTLRTLERPRNWCRNYAGIQSLVYSVLSPYSPNIDGVYQLSDLYVGRSDEGIRGKIGNEFYVLNPGGAVDGDIIEVRVEGVVKKYRYTLLGKASSIAGKVYTSLPTECIAFRIG